MAAAILTNTYDEAFYEKQFEGARRSARTILSSLYPLFKPASVVDFGCGRGAWLAAAGELGSAELIGFDGPWVKPESLADRRIHFSAVDMEQPITLERRCDLAISVEVAEHLTPRRAQSFVADICRAADVVVFGAAVKNQGGDSHINEQFQSYWIAQFERQGYDCFDIFRPQIWNNAGVEYWYRQNTFLFLNRNADLPQLSRAGLRALQQPIPDVIHPEQFETALRILEKPSLRTVMWVAKRYLTSIFGGPRRDQA